VSGLSRNGLIQLQADRSLKKTKPPKPGETMAQMYF